MVGALSNVETLSSALRRFPGPRVRAVVAVLAGAAAVFLLASRLRGFEFLADQSLAPSINIIGIFLSLTLVANAMVRFRGLRDNTALALGIGFAVAGFLEMASTISIYRHLDSVFLTGRVRPSWTEGRMLLAEAMLFALPFLQLPPRSANGDRKFDLGLLVSGTVILLSGTACVFYLKDQAFLANGPFPRPWELLPAAMFLLATTGFQVHVQKGPSMLDRSLTLVAAMNAGAHICLLESPRPLDAAATFAQLLRVSSYAILLGAMLVDNSRLFAQVHQLATRDPLTGLANYRHLLASLETEIERSGRTGREFSVLLLDLDELKKVNDSYGHLVGSRAICRVAEALKVGCRSLDTTARYGGDEFAVVLPETGERAAMTVASRIREQLATQPEFPRLSVSTGLAVFPADGPSAERLLFAADRALYIMKAEQTHQTKHLARFQFRIHSAQ